MKRLADKPFALLGINSDRDREKLKTTLAKERINWRSWWDEGSINGPIQTRWAIAQRPAIFVLDGKGVIRYKDVVGEELDRAVDGLLIELASSAAGEADEPSARALRRDLSFHAPFDGTADAAFARGDRRIYTSQAGNRQDGSPGLSRDDVTLEKGKGKYGDALRFGKKAKPVLYFKAEKNVDYRKSDWSGTVSLWLSLDPAVDLEPGYCDPIQITDKKWNDASFFVDFTKDNPRDFRLGAFADYKVWNPTDRKWDDVPESERPMVSVKKPPFERGKWTHVAFTFSSFNTDGKKGRAKFYLNGEYRGELKDRRQHFTWDPSKAAILIGLSYIGLFDELAIFDRELGADEVKALYELPGGIASVPQKE